MDNDESNNNNLVTMAVGHTFNTAYGTFIIHGIGDKNIYYEWTFNVMVGSKYANVLIGIDSFYCMQSQNKCFTEQPLERSCYALSIYTGKFDGYHTESIPRAHYFDGSDCGGIIKLIVNYKTNTISYFHNDRNLGIAANSIPLNEKYVMAVCISGKQSKVKLLDFKRSSC